MKDMAFGNEKIIARWHRSLGDVPTTRLEKASHYLQEDQPEVIAEAIKRLIAKM